MFLLKQIDEKEDIDTMDPKPASLGDILRNTTSYQTLFSFVFNHDRATKIYCIKEIRTRTQCGLLEAKLYCEAVWNGWHPVEPTENCNADMYRTMATTVKRPPPVVPAVPDFSEIMSPVHVARRAYLAAIANAATTTGITTDRRNDVISHCLNDLDNATDFTRSLY